VTLIIGVHIEVDTSKDLSANLSSSRDNRRPWRIAINTHGYGDTGINSLMIVDSRIYYRMLVIALLNKLACFITCYHFACNRNVSFTLESEGIQFDSCFNRVHAQCEGILRELCKSFSHVSSGIANISYYCEINACSSQVKPLVFNYLNTMNQQIDTLLSTHFKLQNLIIFVPKITVYVTKLMMHLN